MKSRSGSAAIVILVVAIILVIAGAIAWVHYYYLPHMAVEDMASSTAATTTPIQPLGNVVGSSSTPAVTSSSASGVCGTDINCFIADAKTCTPSSAQFEASETNDGVITNTQLQLGIQGLNTAGKCNFSTMFSDVTSKPTAQGDATLKSQGYTDAQIQAQMQEGDQLINGVAEACLFSASDLVQLLTSWSTNSSNPVAIIENSNCKSSGGGSIQFSSSLPAGSAANATIYLSAGQQETINNLQFTVNTLTASQLNATIADTATGESQAVSFAINTPVTVLGHTMTVTSIANVSEGTVNGQPVSGEQATLSYN